MNSNLLLNINKKSLFFRALILLFCLQSMTACHSITTLTQELGFTSSTDNKWLDSGSLVIARVVPNRKVVSGTQSLKGFIPKKTESNQETMLLIERANSKVQLFHGSIKLAEFSIKNISDLEAGEYQIVHKQRHPVWYAPDDYYSRRSLDVPKANSQDRYLKGALGDFVVYLDEDTALHNSLVWSEEVGGIRIADKDIAQIYYKLDIGSVIRVE
jgi:hypothetical protein